MEVRDINTRITHIEYARKTNSELPGADDSHEVGNVQGVLDGDLDGFVRAELLRRAGGSNGA